MSDIKPGDFITFDFIRLPIFDEMKSEGSVYKVIGISRNSLWDLDCVTAKGTKFYASKNFYKKIELTPLERILHGFDDE